MENKVHFADLHVEKNTWISTLVFCQDELEIMNTRLLEIANANSKIEVTAQVEHFQNQFIVQKEVLDTLRHDIHKSEGEMVRQIEANPIATERKTAPDHIDLRDHATTFDKLIADLTQEFNTFAVKTL